MSIHDWIRVMPDRYDDYELRLINEQHALRPGGLGPEHDAYLRNHFNEDIRRGNDPELHCLTRFAQAQWLRVMGRPIDFDRVLRHWISVIESGDKSDETNMMRSRGWIIQSGVVV